MRAFECYAIHPISGTWEHLGPLCATDMECATAKGLGQVLRDYGYLPKGASVRERRPTTDAETGRDAIACFPRVCRSIHCIKLVECPKPL